MDEESVLVPDLLVFTDPFPGFSLLCGFSLLRSSGRRAEACSSCVTGSSWVCRTGLQGGRREGGKKGKAGVFLSFSLCLVAAPAAALSLWLQLPPAQTPVRFQKSGYENTTSSFWPCSLRVLVAFYRSQPLTASPSHLLNNSLTCETNSLPSIAFVLHHLNVSVFLVRPRGHR